MSDQELKTVEGYIDFSPPAAGKPCQTWYKIIGDLSSGRPPLVALHGGPGADYHYLAILSHLTKVHSIPLVLYDQCGNGKSTHFPEKMGDTSFFNDQLYLDELDNLLSHLGIQNHYDIIGHSWGGMLAARHAVKQPKGLRRLILFSTPSDMKLWQEAQNELKKRLSQDIQDTIDKHEKEGTTDSKEYQDAVVVYNSHFLCTLDPIPEGVALGLECLQKDPTVYLTMNGPSEFFITGYLKNWTVIPDAHKINVPTLLLNGRLDEAQDSVVMPFFKEIPKVKWVTFEKSSHMSQYEQTDEFMKVVGDFLTA